MGARSICLVLGSGYGSQLSAQVFHLEIVLKGSPASWCLVLTVKLKEGGQPLKSLWVAWSLSSVPMFACSLPGGVRREECGTEVDVSLPALLTQSLPLPTPLPASLPHHPAPTPSVASSLFLPPGQPPVQPELLPAKPQLVYSDAVRGLPGQAPRSLLCTSILPDLCL